MPEMYLRQPGVTYSVSGPFTKNKEEIKNSKKQEIQDIYLSKLTRKSLFWTWYGLWKF